MWKTADGYMQERITDPNTGLTRILSVKVKGNGIKAEQEAAKKLSNKIEKSTDNRIFFSEAKELFLKECEKTLKMSTVRKYDFELKSFYDIVGDCYLDHLTAGFIRKKLLESGKPNRTLNGYLKVFKSFWLWAYRSDLVKNREVTDKLSRFQDTPEKERIQDKYLEPEELRKLLAAMTEEKWLLFSELLVLSGMRIGEAISLNKSDIDGKVIHITKTYDSNNNVVTAPKSFDSKRDIFIQVELRDCIQRINRYVRGEQEVFNFTNGIFFPDENGSYIAYTSYSKYLREVSERTLGRRISPHALRHTHASMLFTKGMNLSSVSARLGHSDSKITKEIYLHRMEELKEKENQQLNSFKLIG